MQRRRLEKINSLIQATLASAIQELFTSEFGLVTVSFVDVSADLREVEVLVDILGPEKIKEQTMNFLETNKKKLQAELAKLELKFTPTIKFRLDTGTENINRINQLLNQINHSGKA